MRYDADLQAELEDFVLDHDIPKSQVIRQALKEFFARAKLPGSPYYIPPTPPPGGKSK